MTSLFSNRLVSSQIIAGRTLNAVPDGALVSFRFQNVGGWPVLSRSEGRGCSAGALSLAKGGILTFAYRSEFFANS